MKMKRALSLLLALLLVVTAATACGKETDPGTEGSTGTSGTVSSDIRVVMREIGNTMDPIIANYTDTSIIMYHVYDRLVSIDDNLDVIPAMADYEFPDNLTIVFTVKDGYVFQNGEALTTDDILYSVERLKELSQMSTFTENLASITADGNVITVKMNEPDSGYIRSFAGIIIVNKKYCEEKGEAYANEPMGTGPFKVKEYIPGDRVVLEAWADYPFEKAKLNTITFVGIPETSAKYIALESGDAQFAAIDSTDRDRADSNSALNLTEKATTNTAFVAMNSQLYPFDNVNVRRAIAYAYDKEAIAGLKPGQTTIDSMFPKMFDTYYSSPNLPAYDLEKAKELLAAEGYDESNPLTFDCWVYSQSPAMEAFQAVLLSIGVTMKIEMLEFGVFLEGMAKGECQLLAGSWNNVDGNPLSAFACYYSKDFGNQNIGFYSNPRCDELYNLAKAATDPDEIKAYAKELQDIAAQDVPIIPSHSTLAYYAYVKELKGVEMLTSALVSFRSAYVEAA